MKACLGFTMTLIALIAVTAATYTPAQETNPPARIYIHSGTLRSIDKQARVIAVERSAISLKFVVPTDAQIIVKDKARGDLSDLMIGDQLEVKYTDEDGVLVAQQISVLGLKTS
jgi:Cu/Ag efflux protein CusF